MRFLSVVLAVACVATRVSAHSWVWCTDYNVQNATAEPMGPDETDAARRNYDDSLCDGYPPSFPTFVDRNDFGRDSGYENRPSADQLCLNSRTNSYSTDFPQANYISGQTVCVAYPAKNHVAAQTTNPFIPDNGVRVYRSNINPGNDGFIQGFQGTEFMQNGRLTDFNGVHQAQTIDYLGFQNCPDFDANNDRALCTMCFEIGNLERGEYQFAWFWEFNGGEFYSTCWNAMVLENDGAPPLETSSEPGMGATTVQTTTTRVVPTVPAGQDICDVEGDALCGRGLGRGECVVNANDADYTCECEDGFENTANPRVCNIEGGIVYRLTFNVPFGEIQSEADLELSLQIELSEQLAEATGEEVDQDRLQFTFSADGQGFLVAILTLQGSFDVDAISVLEMSNALSDMGTDLHGFMSLATSIECLNCDAGVPASAAGALAPSLALLVAAAASSFVH